MLSIWLYKYVQRKCIYASTLVVRAGVLTFFWEIGRLLIRSEGTYHNTSDAFFDEHLQASDAFHPLQNTHTHTHIFFYPCCWLIYCPVLSVHPNLAEINKW
jgi:hypothetical protein